MNLEGVLSKQLIKLSIEATTKEGAIIELADLLDKDNRLKDKAIFIEDVLARENELSTILEGGIALPHAKSSQVKLPSLVVGISKKGINCNSEDGCLTKIFFLIATPENSNNEHIKTLSEVSCKLLDTSFMEKLFNANNEEEAFELITQDTSQCEVKQSNRFLIGVTGCPTGVAHTYLAANSLKKTAISMGFNIK